MWIEFAERNEPSTGVLTASWEQTLHPPEDTLSWFFLSPCNHRATPQPFNHPVLTVVVIMFVFVYPSGMSGLANNRIFQPRHQGNAPQNIVTNLINMPGSSTVSIPEHFLNLPHAWPRYLSDSPMKPPSGSMSRYLRGEIPACLSGGGRSCHQTSIVPLGMPRALSNSEACGPKPQTAVRPEFFSQLSLAYVYVPMHSPRSGRSPPFIFNLLHFHLNLDPPLSD